MTISNQHLGKVVQIDCTTDPLNRQGQFGTVVQITEQETAIIEFSDGVTGEYDLDCFGPI